MDARSRFPGIWIGPAVFLYGATIASAFTFLIYTNQALIEPTIDLNGFGMIARHIARGEGFSIGFGPTIRRAPLYPFLGAVVLKMFGNDVSGWSDAEVYRPLLVANCVILGLTCLAVRSLARRIFNTRIALLAALICPLLPQSLRYVGMTEVETLMGLWTVLLALSSHALLTQPGAPAGAMFGAVAAAATLTKPVTLLYPFVFLPLALWSWKSKRAIGRDAVVGSLVAATCFGILLLPWSLRNNAVTGGKFMGISSNAPGEFLRGYINAQSKYFLLRQDFGGSGPGEKWDPEANAYEADLLARHGVPYYRVLRLADGKTYVDPPPPPGSNSVVLELERDRIEGMEMKRRLTREPGAFIFKSAVQFATFWYLVETRMKSVLVGIMALAVLALCARGAVRAHNHGALVWPILLVILYFNAFYAAFLAFARYSMPLFPMLSVLLAGGLVSVFEDITRTRSRIQSS